VVMSASGKSERSIWGRLGDSGRAEGREQRNLAIAVFAMAPCDLPTRSRPFPCRDGALHDLKQGMGLQ
jgi:hypothetical protein